jgi:hypothetical protein
MLPTAESISTPRPADLRVFLVIDVLEAERHQNTR